MPTIVLIAIAVLIYLFISIIIADDARDSKLPFLKILIICIFFTPIYGLIYVNLNGNKYSSNDSASKYKCRVCKFEFYEGAEYCPLCAKEGKKHRLKPLVHNRKVKYIPGRNKIAVS